MYTYILTILITFLLSGIIFKKRIKEYQFFIYLIAIVVSIISTTIVNRILTKDIDYIKYVRKTIELDDIYNPIIKLDNANDSLTLSNYKDTLNIKYVYCNYTKYNKDSSEIDTIYHNYIKIDGNVFNQSDTSILSISFDNDIEMAYLKVFKFKRNISSKWVANFALPQKKYKEYTLVLPKNAKYEKIYGYLNKYYYEKEI